MQIPNVKLYKSMPKKPSPEFIRKPPVYNEEMRVIYTIFAGRERNLRIQFKYIEELYRKGVIHELHLWNFTRSDSDELWIKLEASKPYLMHFTSIMSVKNKDSWREYYAHYTQEFYPNHIIIKADDDIVFIDTEKMPAFLNSTKFNEKTHKIMHPQIINNEVCLHFQQKQGIWPEKFPIVGGEGWGPLWGNGHIAQDLITHFISNRESFLKTSCDSVVSVPHEMRVSINLFAITSANLNIFQNLAMHSHPDDEYMISVELPKELGFFSGIDSNCFIIHAAFYKQRETGMDENEVLRLCEDVALAKFS
jgi:hypothetical protein